MRAAIRYTFLHRLRHGWPGRICSGSFFCAPTGEKELKAINLQISVFPAPKYTIHIADAVAIKVRPHYVHLVGCL
jgi:hypothetical protein